MRSKSYYEMKGVSKELLDLVVEADGLPDNFVESAAGTISGLPDLESHPQALAIVKALDDGLAAAGADLADLSPTPNGHGQNGDHPPRGA